MNFKSSLFYYSWVIFALINSCSQQEELVQYNVDKEFTDKSFSSTVSLQHTKVIEDFIGNPVRLTVIDTLLFAVDSKLDSLVHIYNIKTDTYCGLFIGRGAGPNELVSIGYITPSYKKEYIGAYDITTRQWLEFNVPELLTNKQAGKTDRVQFV